MKLLFALTISIFGVAFSHPRSYVDALRSYDGKPYLEETCSALICDAHDHVSTAKTRCTARELWNGCGGTLAEVAEAGSLGELDWSTVQAGDVLAMNGVHVIAYLGDGQCIDSDPLLGGVGEVSVDALVGKKNDVWFSGPVRVKRWVR